ncbi:MAG: UDP-3-O-acyl-N-acetylglucosamine deacetylase [Thermodesulfobacteriota bacterium]
MHLQRTVAQSVSIQGEGLHTGKRTTMWIHPAPADHGIAFVRSDIPGGVRIPARLDFVVDTNLATTLGRDGVAVWTVEHLLSAFLGTGIDNALVELDGPEVPILDGSSAGFVRAIRCAGAVEQPRLRKYLVVQRPFHLSDGDRRVSLFPCPEFVVSFQIEFDHPSIGHQFLRFRLSDEHYEREICRARTFGFLRDVEAMRVRGYARGGSLENALVLDDHGVLNEGGLRYPDEFVRHKVLDSLGDLSLLGSRLLGHFVAHKAGHTLNHRLLKHLRESQSGWKMFRFQPTEGAVGHLSILPESSKPEELPVRA